MRCAWCHNPEGLSAQPQILLDPEKCIGCGLCQSVCTAQAHTMENGQPVFNRTRCTSCGRCAEICPAQALEMAGGEWTAESLCRELVQDAAYYRQSGVGVTLSCGYVMCHMPFSL